eukprot:17590-Chlamydomonas_euryale.AAC.8
MYTRTCARRLHVCALGAFVRRARTSVTISVASATSTATSPNSDRLRSARRRGRASTGRSLAPRGARRDWAAARGALRCAACGSAPFGPSQHMPRAPPQLCGG